MSSTRSITYTPEETQAALKAMSSDSSYRWRESPTQLTPYQLLILNQLRQQMDGLPFQNSTPTTSSREMFELQYLGLVDVVLYTPLPSSSNRTFHVEVTLRLTLEGYFFLSQAFIVQRLIEYISPVPTLHTLVRHQSDHRLTGKVVNVYPSGKLRVRWDPHTYYPNLEHDLDPQFVERYR